MTKRRRRGRHQHRRPSKGIDYILCLNTSVVPSEAVSCTFCGCDLQRSLTSPKAQPICMDCMSRATTERSPNDQG